MDTMIEPRDVHMFATLAGAERDGKLRGDCVIVDLHGLLWSVPTELTIHQVNRQVIDTLDARGLPLFPRSSWRAE